ncbi:MAG: hypothetical protein LBU91_05750 [Bacteroidales bacterium]|jgi:hypothetical protein|nr:hypothetical protein [Bacteroidales bacterium]
MKTITNIVVLLAILLGLMVGLTSCNDKQTYEYDESKRIIGRWQLVKSVQWQDKPQVVYYQHNTIVYEFKEDSVLTFSGNSEIAYPFPAQSRYSISFLMTGTVTSPVDVIVSTVKINDTLWLLEVSSKELVISKYPYRNPTLYFIKK